MSLFAIPGIAVIFKTTVNVSSSQILALKTTPVQMVGAQGEGRVIVPIRIGAVYTHVSAAYTHDGEGVHFGNATLATSGFSYLASLAGAILTQAESQNGIADMDFKGVWPSAYLANQPLNMYYPGAANPAAGNGTMAVTVAYMVL